MKYKYFGCGQSGDNPEAFIEFMIVTADTDGERFAQDYAMAQFGDPAALARLDECVIASCPTKDRALLIVNALNASSVTVN